MKAMNRRPGGELAARQLHFIWMVDCSGSMGADGKIEALNNAVDEAIPHMREVAAENPNAQLMVRVVRFSNGAQWHVSQPTPIDQFQWTPLSADGVTDLGKALAEVAEQLSVDKMPPRALPPVLVLLSDGQPTDDYKAGLKKMMDQPWGKKAVRIAIAIGQDADFECLQAFIANPELKPLAANNADRLTQLIKWSSTAVVQSASAPASQVAGSNGPVGNVPIPEPPDPANLPASAQDVW
jgi:uncharacterized protein YegL